MKKKLTPCDRGGHREGGKECLYENVKRIESNSQTPSSTATYSQKILETPANSRVYKTVSPSTVGPQIYVNNGNLPSIDRTTENIIASQQARTYGGFSTAIYSPRIGQTQQLIGEVGKGNRKDIRAAISSLSPFAGERWQRGALVMSAPSQIVTPAAAGIQVFVSHSSCPNPASSSSQAPMVRAKPQHRSSSCVTFAASPNL